jgi:subtilisin family serine protease
MEAQTDSVYVELFKQAIKAGADIISCSWGTGNISTTLKNYIDDISVNARDGKGVIVIFASGNENQDMGNDESAIDSVIGVGATDKSNLRTSYSDYGKDLDIMAPGGYALGITTIDPLGDSGASSNEYNRYDTYHNGQPTAFVGTSASAPIMAGVIALALQKDTNLTRVEVQELLKQSTSTIGNNTPYLDDMIVSSSSTPTITGLYGASEETAKEVMLSSNSNYSKYGPYSIDSMGNNEWSSTVTDSLANGFYTIKIVSKDDRTTVWATDEDFEINTSKEDKKDKTKRKSNYYGYGKIDLDKFIKNIQ